jgi:hypothetical protein
MTLSRSPRSAGLAAVVATAAIAIAGCGGGGDGELTAEEYRNAADDICRQFEERTDALEEPTSEEGVVAFLEAGLAINREQLAELRDLEPPDDLAEAHDAAMGFLDEQLTGIQEASDRIKDGESPAEVIADLSPRIDEAQEKADERARELGLTVCGSDSDEAEPPGESDAADESEESSAATEELEELGADEINRYLVDVQAAAGAMTSFGTSLQEVGDVDALRASSPELSVEIEKFDAAIEAMSGYSISVPALERQRAALVSKGPNLSSSMRRFAEASGTGDAEQIRATLPQIQSAVQEFGEAASSE